MSKLRLLFIKEAQASYISHLDLLRTFQRAFPRTELDIKHSQGYHPHPIISIVLPLPVGQSSDCELLDFEVTQDYLKRERHQAYASQTTPDCRTRCNGCGANKLVGGKCDV